MCDVILDNYLEKLAKKLCKIKCSGSVKIDDAVPLWYFCDDSPNPVVAARRELVNNYVADFIEDNYKISRNNFKVWGSHYVLYVNFKE